MKSMASKTWLPSTLHCRLPTSDAVSVAFQFVSKASMASIKASKVSSPASFEVSAEKMTVI